MPDSILATIDHEAPMLIRWGRGHGVGLFAVKQATPVEIQGVANADLEKPERLPLGIPDDVRIHGRRLWVPVKGRHEAVGSRISLPLKDALELLAGKARPDGVRLDMPLIPPVRSPFGDEMYVACSMQAAGRIPSSAADHVEPARERASRAVANHAPSQLLHDGNHLYSRLPSPMVSGPDPGRLTFQWSNRLHRPDYLHTRLGPNGLLPYGGTECIPPLVEKLERLDRFLEGIDLGDDDIAAFVATAPAALAHTLMKRKAPSDDGMMARLWPLVLSGALGEEPEGGRETAAETVREIALRVRDEAPPSAANGAAAFRSLYEAVALESYAGFVEKVVRPALAAPVASEDEAAMGHLAP